MEQEYIKLIFGLKLKQVRTEKELSLFGLSKISGLSKSYLNEIEKGKKYPKPDKIAVLANCLNVTYDDLVSLKLNKNLLPVAKILESNILKEIPFELFGIKESTLIDIVANAPAKVSAFITTLIEIAKNYNFGKDNFYLASVRSFQEANQNFFLELEKKVISFAKNYQIDRFHKISSKDLEDILIEEYGYTIQNEELVHPELNDLRSIFIPSSQTLLISHKIDESQRAFIYAKELANNYLVIDKRLYTFPWIQFKNFEEVLNNFYASYFAGALLIPREALVKDLENIFKKENIKAEHFQVLVRKYQTSPETFFQRLTNILPKDFGFTDLFFLRFSHSKDSKSYDLTKELHLSNSHAPRANQSDEHYCRRWISLKVFDDLETNTSSGENFGIQISNYPEEQESYLVLSSATEDPFKHNQLRSISIGLPLNSKLKRRVKFLDSSIIQHEQVGVTCERCNIQNCSLRQSPPLHLEREVKNQNTKDIVEKLTEKYKNG